MPTGGLVRQPVFGHQADSQSLDAAGVEALGQSQVGQINTEVATAAGAAMLGVGNNKIDRTVRARVAQIVQGARGNRITPRAVRAATATPSGVVVAAAFDPRLGKILDAGNALGDIGDVFAWTMHGSPS